jgi:all-trans-retinol 13,14-reductase
MDKYHKTYNENHDFSDVDHIIIGSGIGGLTIATWLAKANQKVVVFEQHFKPGGFTHSFKRKKGFQWDVGVHYVGNVGKGQPLRMHFDYLTDGELDWEYMGDIYDVVEIAGERFEFKSGKDNLKSQLLSYFPKEEDALTRYFELIDKSNKRASLFFMEKAFPAFLSKIIGGIFKKRFFRFSEKSTLEVLSDLTSNQKLIAVLCGQCGNYGLTPKLSSFAAHALVIGHFIEGGYYPKGGADQICHKILKTLNKHDGEVFIKAQVDEIVISKNKTQGVRIGDKFIPCTSVISNVGANNTFQKLIRKKIHDFSDLENSNGHMCLYVGLDVSDEEIDLPKHNLWYYKNENLDDLIEGITLENSSSNFAYISFPSKKDPLWNKQNPGTATIQALTMGKMEWFKEFQDSEWMQRGDAYLQMKNDFEKNMLEKLYELFPQIKGHVIETEVSSPLSTRHFTKYSQGEIYGLAHNKKRFKADFLRPETKVKGLRLVGQDVTIVGVSGAMMSGLLCAITILKFSIRRNFKQLRRFKQN